MDLTFPINTLKNEVKKLLEHKKLMNGNNLFEGDIDDQIHDTMVAIEVLRGKIDLDDESELNLQNVSQQRELLSAFCDFVVENECNIKKEWQQLHIDDFLADNCG